MFTLYRIVKRCVAESVPDRASVHTRTAAFKAVSAPEQYCSAPLLKVERSVSDRFLRRSESSLNTFIGAEIATEPRYLFKSKESVANCITVPDQIGTLSQVGTKKISKGGWTILELFDSYRNHYLNFRSQSDK